MNGIPRNSIVGVGAVPYGLDSDGYTRAPKSPVDVGDVTVHTFRVCKLLVAFRAAVSECSVCVYLDFCGESQWA